LRKILLNSSSFTLFFLHLENLNYFQLDDIDPFFIFFLSRFINVNTDFKVAFGDPWVDYQRPSSLQNSVLTCAVSFYLNDFDYLSPSFPVI